MITQVFVFFTGTKGYRWLAVNIRKHPGQSLSYKERLAGSPTPCQQAAPVQRFGAPISQLWFSTANICLQFTFQPDLYTIYTRFYLSLYDLNTTQLNLVEPNISLVFSGKPVLLEHTSFISIWIFPNPKTPPEYHGLQEKISAWALLHLLDSSKLLIFFSTTQFMFQDPVVRSRSQHPNSFPMSLRSVSSFLLPFTS